MPAVTDPFPLSLSLLSLLTHISLLSLYPTNTHVLLCPAADYVSLTTELTFEVMSTQCVTITITDNDVTEPEETFSVTLVPVSDFVTIRGISSSSVVIEDDDCESHWWSNVLLLTPFSPQLSQCQCLCWMMSLMRKMVQG